MDQLTPGRKAFPGWMIAGTLQHVHVSRQWQRAGKEAASRKTQVGSQQSASVTGLRSHRNGHGEYLCVSPLQGDSEQLAKTPPSSQPPRKKAQGKEAEGMLFLALFGRPDQGQLVDLAGGRPAAPKAQEQHSS